MEDDERDELAGVLPASGTNDAAMGASLVVEFTKMSGAGNDFIVIDNRFYVFSDRELARIAQSQCRRRRGIGADGVLAFCEATVGRADFRMRYVNADGSLGTMCANGARCLVRYAQQAGMDRRQIRLETDSGIYEARLPADGEADVRLYMQQPAGWCSDVALAEGAALPIPYFHYIWTGTEHMVCFVADIEEVPVTRWGRRIRHDPALAPAGANVNFVEVLSPCALRVRTYEKGVEAETLACGTGAVASAAAAWRLRRTRSDAVTRVEMPGGTLHVGSEGGRIALDGPAEAVFRGTFELAV